MPDFGGVLSINGQSYNGTSDVTIDTIQVQYGGTGHKTWTQNQIIYASNSSTLTQTTRGQQGSVLAVSSSGAPGWITQNSLAVGLATKASQDSNGNVITETYRPLTNNTFDSINVTTLNGGTVKATNGFQGNLTGTASEATHAASADSATKATQDGNGANIANTYFKLSGGTVTGDVLLKRSNINAQASNNGVTTVTYPTTFSINDMNNLIMTRLEAVVEPNGNISAYWYVRNYNGSTTPIGQKGIKMTIDKANNFTYTVSDPDKFRTAISLNNVTNDKQIKGLASGTTSGHFVSWGSDGYTVADSGYGAGQIVKSLASNNEGKIVLEYLDGTTSAPIEVKIIGSSGSSVSYADALNVNGTAVGSATEPVFINAQGKPIKANAIPKLNNTTTGGTFYAPTSGGTSGQVLKSNGTSAPTWVDQSSIAAGTASTFAANQSITLTGDTTGTASSKAGWSIATTTAQITPTSLTNKNLNDYRTTQKTLFYYGSGTNGCTNVPSGDGTQFGMITYGSASGHVTQELSSYAGSTSGKWIRCYTGSSWTGWERFITSSNYTTYTVTKTGGGASGTWAISISGNAASATSANTAAALTGITAGRFVIGNGTSSAYASSQMSYYNNVDITANSHTVKRNGIHIWGQTYGNDAAYLVSGIQGVLSWGDGGPQITFDTSGTPGAAQAGALIFTDHDSAATGASFHFVSNQGDWSVVSKRFVARTSISIGIDPQHSSAGMQQIYNATTKSLDFVFY